MTISFTRSGGFAAVPALRIQAMASLSVDGGIVNAAGYSRTMAASEASALAHIAAQASAPPARETQTGAVRDVFVYRFSIVADDGAMSTLTLADAGEPLPHAEQQLLDWARTEAAAIAAHL